MASAWSVSLNGGLGTEPPAGSRGRAPGGGSGERNPLQLKAFCTFLHKKWSKVKDLSENLPPYLSRADIASPKFWSMGAAALTAHSWIRYWRAWVTLSWSMETNSGVRGRVRAAEKAPEGGHRQSREPCIIL